MNPWHDLNLYDESPEIVPVVTEIPKGSKVKYELEKETGLLAVDRILHSAVHYPANYGFIPKTYCDDKDPLDILVLGQENFYPMSICRARPIGVIRMIDGGEGDDKIIAVHVDDPEYRHIKDLSDLPEHRALEIARFFEDYKILEKKSVEITGIDGAKEALEVVRESIELYKKTFK